MDDCRTSFVHTASLEKFTRRSTVDISPVRNSNPQSGASKRTSSIVLPPVNTCSVGTTFWRELLTLKLQFEGNLYHWGVEPSIILYLWQNMEDILMYIARIAVKKKINESKTTVFALHFQYEIIMLVISINYEKIFTTSILLFYAF